MKRNSFLSLSDNLKANKECVLEQLERTLINSLCADWLMFYSYFLCLIYQHSHLPTKTYLKHHINLRAKTKNRFSINQAKPKILQPLN